MHALPGDAQVFGQDAGFGYCGHEIGVAYPAGQGVEMQMAGYACSSGLAQVHTEIDAVRGVERGQDALGLLCQIGQFMSGCLGQGGEAGLVFMGNDHDVAGGVGIGIEADEAGGSAQDQAGCLLGFVDRGSVGDGVIDGGEEVAENAAEVAGPAAEAGRDAGTDGLICRGDILIAPGCPELIHGQSIDCR